MNEHEFALGDRVVLVHGVRLCTRRGKSIWCDEGLKATITELMDEGLLGMHYRLRFDDFKRYRDPLAKPVQDGLLIFEHISIVDRLAVLGREGRIKRTRKPT